MWSKAIYLSLHQMNLLLKSIKTSWILEIALKHDKNKEAEPLKDWIRNEARSFVNFYADRGYCQRVKNDLVALENTVATIPWVEDNLEDLLLAFFDDTEELHDFMLLHSVFSVDALRSRCRVQKFFIKWLQPTAEQMDMYFNPPELPADVAELLAPLDPVVLTYIKDPVRLEYDMFKKRVDPINIVYEYVEDWIDKDHITEEEFIEQYSPIPVSKLLDDDLPF